MFVWHKLMKVLHKTLLFYQLFDYQNAILSFQGCHTKIQASFWQDFGWKVPSRSGKTFWDRTSLYTCNYFSFFSGCSSEKFWRCTPHSPPPRGLKIKIANGKGNQIELKAKSATVHAIMHTKLCDSVCLYIFFCRKPREVFFFQRKVLARY